MNINKLIQALQQVEEKDVELFITQDPINDEQVLGFCPDPSNPDNVTIISLETGVVSPNIHDVEYYDPDGTSPTYSG